MPQNEIFRGVVVSGRGLAGSTLTRSAIKSEMAEMTGLRMVPGKLNVVLGEDCTEKLQRREVLIAGRFRGLVFQGDEPEYPPNHVELVSDHKLRVELNLEDGETIEFSTIRSKHSRSGVRTD